MIKLLSLVKVVSYVFWKTKTSIRIFGVSDFVDIYTLLNKDVEPWYNKFKNIEQTVNIEEAGEERTKINKKNKSFLDN